MAINQADTIAALKQKAYYVRRETLRIHQLSSETRIASSLSDVEIFVCLYYGHLLAFDPHNLQWEQRDRLIISKGHGGLSLYPILADLGFFAKAELDTVLQEGSTFGSIPDCAIPGFETTNGSLGQGLGVAAGMALGLQTKRNPAKVFVVLGDGELYEGSIWEALSFAAHNKLNNLIAILDYNKISMLGYCEKNLGLEPLEQKFAAFGWQVHNVDGHAVEQVYTCLKAAKQAPSEQPTMVIAHTIKGKGVKELEGNPLCHVRSLSKAEVELAIAVLDDENS